MSEAAVAYRQFVERQADSDLESLMRYGDHLSVAITAACSAATGYQQMERRAVRFDAWEWTYPSHPTNLVIAKMYFSDDGLWLHVEVPAWLGQAGMHIAFTHMGDEIRGYPVYEGAARRGRVVSLRNDTWLPVSFRYLLLANYSFRATTGAQYIPTGDDTPPTAV